MKDSSSRLVFPHETDAPARRPTSKPELNALLAQRVCMKAAKSLPGTASRAVCSLWAKGSDASARRPYQESAHACALLLADGDKFLLVLAGCDS
jgi:hypothetical protein